MMRYIPLAELDAFVAATDSPKWLHDRVWRYSLRGALSIRRKAIRDRDAAIDRIIERKGMIRRIFRIEGQSFEQWAAALFEYEYCEECGGDVEDHEPRIVLGHWFAKCKKEAA